MVDFSGFRPKVRGEDTRERGMRVSGDTTRQIGSGCQRGGLSVNMERLGEEEEADEKLFDVPF